MIKKWFVVATVVGLSTAAFGVRADLGAQTQARKHVLQAHYDRIMSDDTLEAIAATEVGLQSNDPELRAMSLEAALRSDNSRVQTTALRGLLSERKKLLFRTRKPAGADKGDHYAYELWHAYVLTVRFDPHTDEIKDKNAYFGGGQLVRGGIELHYNYSNNVTGFRCAVRAAVDPEAAAAGIPQLQGDIECWFPSSEKHRTGGDQDGKVELTIGFS